MPTTSLHLTGAQQRKLIGNLQASEGHNCINRLLSVLADEQIRNGENDAALRKELQRVVVDEQLLEVINNDVAWLANVQKADGYVAALKTVAGKRALLEKNAALLLAKLAAPEAGALGDVLGEQALRLSEVGARIITAVVGVRILRSNAVGNRGVLVSQAGLAAELGVDKDAVHRALKWAEQNRILRPDKRYKGGLWRWVFCYISPTELDKVKSRVNDVILAVTGRIWEEANAAQSTPEVVDEEVDERMEARKDRQRLEALERMNAAGVHTSKFGDIFSTYNPLGMLADLDPLMAPMAVADVLLAAESVIWRRAFSDLGATPKVWLALYAGALGELPSDLGSDALFDENRGNKAFGRGWVKRLNEGERLRDMIVTAETLESLAKRDELVAVRSARHHEFFESRAQWTARMVEAEEFLNAMFESKGKPPIPKEDEPKAVIRFERAVEKWMSGAQTFVAQAWLSAEQEVMAAARLSIRLERRGYRTNSEDGEISAASVANRIFDIIDASPSGGDDDEVDPEVAYYAELARQRSAVII